MCLSSLLFRLGRLSPPRPLPSRDIAAPNTPKSPKDGPWAVRTILGQPALAYVPALLTCPAIKQSPRLRASVGLLMARHAPAFMHPAGLAVLFSILGRGGRYRGIAGLVFSQIKGQELMRSNAGKEGLAALTAPLRRTHLQFYLLDRYLMVLLNRTVAARCDPNRSMTARAVA